MTILRRLGKVGKTFPHGFVIDVRKEQKRGDVCFSATCPRHVVSFTDNRNEAEVPWRVDRNRKPLKQTEVGKIAPGLPLMFCQNVARSHVCPIEAYPTVETGMIIRAVVTEEMPIIVPAFWEVNYLVFELSPLAVRFMHWARNIAGCKAANADLAQDLCQNVYRRIDTFGTENFFPELMSRLHDALTVLKKSGLVGHKRYANATPSQPLAQLHSSVMAKLRAPVASRFRGPISSSTAPSKAVCGPNGRDRAIAEEGANLATDIQEVAGVGDARLGCALIQSLPDFSAARLRSGSKSLVTALALRLKWWRRGSLYERPASPGQRRVSRRHGHTIAYFSKGECSLTE